ncbi:cell division protein ZapA [Maritalea sp.]|uniref:cell division protein ZapA n=1 Tax=Maritalea sp. TaxID=2003361 RepID=UPI003EF21118
MAEINVEIDGRKYRMACEDGQEGHVRDLATRFSNYVEGLKGEFGEAGDTRLTVMAALTVMDDLSAAQKELMSAKNALDQLALKSNKLVEERDGLEEDFAKQIIMVSERVELLAAQLANATQTDQNAADAD